MTCTAETANGIPYVETLYLSSFEYRTVVDDLDSLLPYRRRVMGGSNVVSYTIGNESINRGSQMSAAQILALWDELSAKKLSMESGGRRKPRRAVGVVPRDW